VPPETAIDNLSLASH